MAVRTVQYVSQFDPAAEQLSQNVLRDKQARFDQAYAGLINEYARQGDVFSLDPEYKEKQMQQFRDKASEVIDKYNGDYGAASKELAALVAQERQNPFYNLNKMHIQKKAEEMALKNKYGADAIVLKGVPDSLEEVVNDPSKLDYEIYDRSKMNNKFLQITEDLVKPRVTAPKKIKGMEGYLAQDYEVTPEDIDNITQDEEDINMIMEAVPELARIAESQGLNTKSFIQKYARTMLSDRVGIYRRDYIRAGTKDGEPEVPLPSDRGFTLDILRKSRVNETDFSEQLGETQTGVKGIANNVAAFFKGIVDDDFRRNEMKVGQDAAEEYDNLPDSEKRLFSKGEYVNEKVRDWRKQQELVFDEENLNEIALTFSKLHPNLFGKDGTVDVKEVLKAKDDLNKQWSAEFSKIHIPSTDFNTEESNFVFVTKEGKPGNVFSRQIIAYDKNGDMINLSDVDNFYKLVTGKSGDKLTNKEKEEALGDIGIQGLTYTGTTPVSLIANTLNGDILEIENTNEVKEIGSTVWAIAETLRKDNNSPLIEGQAKNYGIFKDDDGLYVIPNRLDYLKDNYGIHYFKAKNELIPTKDVYLGKPKLMAYDENMNPLGEYETQGNVTPLDILINHTEYQLMEEGYIKKKKD
jgi:hypothetical protein